MKFRLCSFAKTLPVNRLTVTSQYFTVANVTNLFDVNIAEPCNLSYNTSGADMK